MTAATIVEKENVGVRNDRNNVNVARQLVVHSPATADNEDKFTVTLADYGMTTILGVYGVTHTTANSVIVAENPTTAVSAGVLTVSYPSGGTDNQIRVSVIYYV